MDDVDDYWTSFWSSGPPLDGDPLAFDVVVPAFPPTRVVFPVINKGQFLPLHAPVQQLVLPIPTSQPKGNPIRVEEKKKLAPAVGRQRHAINPASQPTGNPIRVSVEEKKKLAQVVRRQRHVIDQRQVRQKYREAIERLEAVLQPSLLVRSYDRVLMDAKDEIEFLEEQCEMLQAALETERRRHAVLRGMIHAE